jgi:enhancing lycopene biosynthesis protein 2
MNHKKVEKQLNVLNKHLNEQYVAETKKAEIQNIRSVRQQIRQARVARSSMLNVGAQTGGYGW